MKRDLGYAYDEIAQLRLRCDARSFPYYNVIKECFLPKELEKFEVEHTCTCNVCGLDM